MAGYIDMNTWKRVEHYKFFARMDHPFFNICAPLDITKFQAYIKEHKERFFLAFLYLTMKVANEIDEFRLRIRENGIYIHDQLHPSFTIMGQDDLFCFCYCDYEDCYANFKLNAAKSIDNAQKESLLKDEIRDDYLYITSLPWVSFTSISHPFAFNKTDSVPRISWGKFEERDGRVTIPMSVSLHHGLADGLHAGRYFQRLQQYLDHPEDVL